MDQNELGTESTEQESSNEEKVPAQSSAPSDEGETNEESDSSETEQADGTEADGDEQSEQQEQEKPKKNGFKSRIDRLNRKVSEREQRIASLEAELEKTRKPNQETQESSAEVGKEPDPNDFDTNAEYIKALNKYHRDLDKAEAKKESEASKQRETHEAIRKDHLSRVDQFKKAQPDFDEVVEEFTDTYGEFRASPAIIEALMTSELGPNVLYEVLKDHAEYDRLSKLSESAIIREIGKIEARILSKKEASAANAQKASKAPSPVSPIGKGAVPVSKSLSDPNLSFAEYEKIRLKELKTKK